MIISISHHYYDHYYPFIISLTTTIITIYKLDTSTMITNIIMAYMIMIALKLVHPFFTITNLVASGDQT